MSNRAHRLVGLLVRSILLNSCDKSRPNRTFLIPSGYVGPFQIEYEVEGAPSLGRENGRILIIVPKDGFIRTSDSSADGWGDPDEFFYVSGKQRERLHGPYEPYEDGHPYIQMIWPAGAGGGTGSPPTEWFFAGTDKQNEAYIKTHGVGDGWMKR
jgi:hypothetical protein